MFTNLTHAVPVESIRDPAVRKGRWRSGAVGTAKFNCPFENETVLYDATDSHPNLGTDPVGAARLSHR
jgi:hypothetical protein